MNRFSNHLAVIKAGPGAWLRSLLNRERVWQTLVLYSSEIGLVILTMGTGILNSRFLGPTQYGFYTFVITIVEVLNLLGGLGFAPSGARMVALAKSRPDEQAIQGTLVVVGVALGLCLSVLMAISSPLIDLVFHTRLQTTLLMGSFLCVTTPLQLILNRVCHGANRIGILAILNIVPKVLYLLGGLGMVLWAELTANTALMLYFGGAMGSCLFTIFMLRVRFENVRGHLRELNAEVQRYGFKTYIGGLADNSTFKLNNLLIAGYVDTVWLGFYNIASTMVSPMVSFSASLSTSAFRSLARKQKVNPKLLWANALFLSLSALLVAACARPVVEVLLTKKFLPAVGLVYVLIFTASFKGMYQPLNAFLCAHGKGRELRSISFVVSIVNLVVSLMLIPRLGAYGAAVGSGVAKLTELLGNLYYYKKAIREPLLGAIDPVPAPEPLSS